MLCFVSGDHGCCVLCLENMDVVSGHHGCCVLCLDTMDVVSGHHGCCVWSERLCEGQGGRSRSLPSAACLRLLDPELSHACSMDNIFPWVWLGQTEAQVPW